MRNGPDIRFDVVSVLNRGCRDYQEDAIATDFPIGAEFGFAVLSDGMGGHAAGDVASKIVVTEVFSELKFQSSDADRFVDNVSDILRSAAISANQCVAAHTSSNPDTAGMGATLIAPVFVRDRLYWISIGDSPFYLYRDGELRQLNEDHSLGPHIDYMVRSGMMSEDVGRNHPDRNALTSVLIGESIDRIDCPEVPLALKDNDIFIVSSDGLQFLSDAQIHAIVGENLEAGNDSAAIAEQLLGEIRDLDDPEQDNVCFSVIRVHFRTPAVNGTAARTGDERAARRRQVTTRPVKPRPEPEPAEAPAAARTASRPRPEADDRPVAARSAPQPEPVRRTSRDPAPMFLRRRWLATDGSA